jgi:predicted GNAT family N-acyltransferase
MRLLMHKVEYISHAALTKEQLDEIIKVKMVAWPYSPDKQAAWMQDNLKSSDVHVLLYINEVIQAYMNLIEINFHLDETARTGYGIGNVCALERGKGWGKELMTAVNSYLDNEGRTGLLFCKDALVKFYAENGWILVDEDRLVLPEGNEHIKGMINKPLEFEQLRYSGKLF